jgi:TDG/mug DNA glycosylase family protein
MGIVLGTQLAAMAYEERLKLLEKRGVGLWDVVGAAAREGSADQAIRDAVHNPIGGLKKDYPGLQAVAFNGGRAAKDGFRLLADVRGLELIALPSSSGLAAIPFAEKARRWEILAQYCRG